MQKDKCKAFDKFRVRGYNSSYVKQLFYLSLFPFLALAEPPFFPFRVQ